MITMQNTHVSITLFYSMPFVVVELNVKKDVKILVWLFFSLNFADWMAKNRTHPPTSKILKTSGCETNNYFYVVLCM